MKIPNFRDFPVSQEVGKVLDAVSQLASPFITGGAVRDWLLGEQSKDLDVEVFGANWDQLISVLQTLGKVDLVGKSFGVAKFYLLGIEVDFSLPRSEVKTTGGHRGFAVSYDPGLSPEQAALRRDFTLNSISFDWKSKQIVDPLNGCRDLEQRALRHCGPGFSEDPLRVLRGFQFCSRFELTPAEETIELCFQIKQTFHELPCERVWMEWEKWATRSVQPSRGLMFLKSTGWLDFFPEIAALDGCPQDPEWHPEGDVFIHTCFCLDSLVNTPLYQSSDRTDRLILMFAVLAHDFGKPETTFQKEKEGNLRWVSPAHDRAGLPLVEKFLESIGAPQSLIPNVQALVGNHMASIQIIKRPTIPQVRRLSQRVKPATLEQLFTVMRSDLAGRPPLPAAASQGLLWLEEVASEESLLAAAPRPLVLGRHLIHYGLQPGPHFKQLLNQLFELQLDGMFDSVVEAEPFIRKLCDPYINQS